MLKNFNRSLITLSVISFSLFAFAGFAHASQHANAEERAAAMEEKKAAREAAMEEREAEREAAMEERKEQREEKMTARCEAAMERVQARIGRMEENREVHEENYDRMTGKLNEIVAAMEEHDVDTSELEAAISTMEGLVSDYSDAFVAFLSKLSDHSTADCDDLEGKNGSRREALEEAKELLEDLKSKRKAMREHYAKNVRGAIQDLRDQVHEARVEAREGVENE